VPNEAASPGLWLWWTILGSSLAIWWKHRRFPWRWLLVIQLSNRYP
jgi:hypothetical protein